MSDTLAIWGGGFRAELLGQLGWLAQRTVYYWGDLDAHGFHILSMLRGHLPQVISVMMDQATLDAHQPAIGVGTPAAFLEDALLTEAERAVYSHLQRSGRRLEQEHLSQAYITARLSALA